jgi:hypothetical protein
MRILHFIPSIDPATGGPVEGLKQRCAIYRMNGHEVEVASLDSPEFVRQCDFPANVVGLGPGWGTYGYTRHAMPWLKANLPRFDVVMVNGVWNYNTIAAHRALAGTDIPWAVFPHGMLDPYFKKRYPFKHLKKVVYWHCLLRRALHDATAVLWHIRSRLRHCGGQPGVSGAMAGATRQAAGDLPGANPSQERDRHSDRGVCRHAGQG